MPAAGKSTEAFFCRPVPVIAKDATSVEGTSITDGSEIHLVLTISKDSKIPAQARSVFFGVAERWLDSFLDVTNTHDLEKGFLFTGVIYNQGRLRTNLRAAAVLLKGCLYDVSVLSQADSEVWAELLRIDVPFDRLSDANLSSMDEGAASCQPADQPGPSTSPTHSKSPRSPARKSAKKAYKKRRAAARKRCFSASSLEDGPIAETPQPADQLPAPNDGAPTALPSTSHDAAPQPCQQSTVLQSQPTVAAQPSRPKKTKWTGVDFSKVSVEVPLPDPVLTILIRPNDPGQALKHLNPLKLFDFINNTFGAFVSYRDIRAGGIAVDLVVETAREEAALSTKDVLGIAVIISRPLNASTGTSSCSAVVHGVHPDLSEAEVKSSISSTPEVLSVKRLAKPGQQSWTVKLTFSGTEAPTKVLLLGRSLTTRRYQERPLQCPNCGRYGHPGRLCRSTTRCMICSEGHSTETCPQPAMPKCGNCGGAHQTNATSCPSRAFQLKVAEVRQAGRLPFKTARAAVTKAARTYAAALKAPVTASDVSTDPALQAKPQPPCRAPTTESPSTAKPATPTFTVAAVAKAFCKVLELLQDSDDLKAAVRQISEIFNDLLNSHAPSEQ